MGRRALAGYAELNAVLDQVRDPDRPDPELTDEQLVGLQVRWATALSARLDAAIEFADHARPLDAVAQAWRELATRHATLRAVLDGAERDSAALADAQRGEFRMLALAAGLAAIDERVEDAVWLGRRLRDLIRDADGTDGHDSRPGSVSSSPSIQFSTARS
ncbi:hypothetical protein [Pseudonocardia acaciae]|uniref:hypothetical protein n=1 Tax=Pseudonocardia acaciae TaxID=551276 RepID=UPI0006884978|nr:hypothetical protein [Pseudonocardia acaciae]